MAESKASQQEVMETFAARLVLREEMEKTLTLAPRKTPGSEGRVLPIRVNFFEVNPQKSEFIGDIVQYDVVMEPSLPKLYTRLFTSMVKQYGQTELGGATLCYDGMSIMYSNKPLAKNQYQLEVILEEEDSRKRREPKPFKVTLKRVSVISLSVLQTYLQGQLNYTPYVAITALEIVLRSACGASQLLNERRSFFSAQDAQPLSGPMEVWRGLFQSLRPSPGRLLLNVDTTTMCFYKSGALLDLVLDVLHLSRQRLPNEWTLREKSQVERVIRGLYVKTTHGNMRKYRIIGLCDTNSETTLFTGKDGQAHNVVAYFMQTYSIRLQLPHLPCVNAGTKQRPVAIPMELLAILPGQRYPKKLNDVQTAEMIKIAAMKPHDKLRKIQEAPRTLALGANNPTLKAFGINIAPDVMTVNARVLAPPTVVYNKSSREVQSKPQDGAWNLRDKVLYQGVSLTRWAIVNLSRCRREELDSFVREMCEAGRAMGFPIENNRPRILQAGPELGALQRHLQDAYSGDTQLVVVILERKETATYAEVKRVTDVVIGKPSQCIVARNLARLNRQFCANVILKMNAKMGGTNSILPPDLIRPISSAPTIVFGADVTHPGIGDRLSRSVAAVVASMDPHCTKFTSSISAQASRQEVIVDLQHIVMNQLRNFFGATKHKPARIIFYRDGVSEGQFGHILNTEVAAIKKACHALQPDYNPPLTFIICQKRHHVRFFPAQRGDSDRSGNCLAGTVVDTAITNPLFRDFYLLAHSGIQGTSRPTHYHVLLDENNMDNDTIQNLTNRLSYTYVRCTRSVSIAPPAYYAHLVAARGRFHFAPDDTTSQMSSGSGGGSGEHSGVYLPLPVPISKTMFFC